MKTHVVLTLTIKVPTSRVQEVSQEILDLVAELGVYDGGELTQGVATVDIQ